MFPVGANADTFVQRIGPGFGDVVHAVSVSKLKYVPRKSFGKDRYQWFLKSPILIIEAPAMHALSNTMETLALKYRIGGV